MMLLSSNVHYEERTVYSVEYFNTRVVRKDSLLVDVECDDSSRMLMSDEKRRVGLGLGR